MRKKLVQIKVLLLATIIPVIISGQSTDPLRQWNAYRGRLLSGFLDNAGLPMDFSLKQNRNILWKTAIPGLGLSSPVIWGDKLFITTATGESDNAGIKPGLYGDVTSVTDNPVHEWKVICIDKNSGEVLWERTAHKGIPAVKRHPKSTHSNSTPATDGNYVVAFFGSEGLYCYDFDGNLKWEKSFGLLKSVFFSMEKAEWEFASSPVIYNGIVVIQCDVLENSFLAAYEISTGRELWKVDRDEYPGWCTPNIYSFDGRDYIAVNGYKHRGGYELNTGKEVWRMSGGGDIQIPAPIIGNEYIYFNSAHGKYSPIMAVRKSASGDITLKEGEVSSEHIAWYRPRGGSYMHTMLLYNNKLYNVNWNGSVNCIDPQTGKDIYNAKLGKTRSFVASPVASDGRIYIVDEEGTVYIISDNSVFELIGEIPLNEVSLTAPAITDGMIIFRTRKHLIAVGNN